MTSKQLKSLYFNNEKITESNNGKLADLFGDINFIEGIHRVVKYQVKNNSAPTYFYRFTYDKDFSLMKTWGDCTLSGEHLKFKIF